MSSSPFVDAPPNDWDIPDDIGLKKKKKKTPQEKAQAREERAKAEKAKKQTAATKQSASYVGNINWMALTFLALFIVPGILTISIQAYDMMYPGAAQERVLREKLVRCYEGIEYIHQTTLCLSFVIDVFFSTYFDPLLLTLCFDHTYGFFLSSNVFMFHSCQSIEA